MTEDKIDNLESTRKITFYYVRRAHTLESTYYVVDQSARRVPPKTRIY